MVPKVEIILFFLFLLVLFLVQPSITTQTENEKLAELQSEMKELKSQMEMLTKKLKDDETSEQSCTSSGKDTSLSKNKKKKKINTSTKDAAQSCQELRKKGHFADGIYQVPHQTEIKKVEAVSCEFKAANDIRGVQIGNIDLKTKSVHFQVQRTTEFTEQDAVITFENQTINYGEAMDWEQGVFTAPVTGIYHFAFSGLTINFLQIILTVTHADGSVDNAASTSVTASPDNSPNGLSVPISSSLYLNVNDKVSVYNSGTGTLSPAIITNVPNTIFSGWLVEEVELS